MSYNSIGDMIKKIRTQKGITQDELADGIISKANLSRLENGKQMPRKEKLDALMQRLGIDPKIHHHHFLTHEEYLLASKKDTLQSLLSAGKQQEAKLVLDELENHPDFAEGLNLQFLLSCKASYMVNESLEPDKIRDLALSALTVTMPSFSEKFIESYYLSDQEARLINILSLAYYLKSDRESAILILSRLKHSLERSYIDDRQKGKMLPFISINLSKYLSMAERYREAIEVCDSAIALCRKTKNLSLIPPLTFNKADCLRELGYYEFCKYFLYEAYYGSQLTGDERLAKTVSNYAWDMYSLSFFEKPK